VRLVGTSATFAVEFRPTSDPPVFLDRIGDRLPCLDSGSAQRVTAGQSREPRQRRAKRGPEGPDLDGSAARATIMPSRGKGISLTNFIRLFRTSSASGTGPQARQSQTCPPRQTPTTAGSDNPNLT
jgi:hypothetical protein